MKRKSWNVTVTGPKGQFWSVGPYRATTSKGAERMAKRDYPECTNHKATRNHGFIWGDGSIGY